MDLRSRLSAGLPARRPRPPDPGAREVPERVRLPLLTLITLQSLDEDYQVAAVRRRAEETRVAEVARAAGARGDPVVAKEPGGSGGSPARRRRVAAGVVVIFGLLITTAALQSHREAGASLESRDSLVSRIEAAKRRVAALQARKARLESSNVTTQRRTTRLVGAATAAGATDTDVAAVAGFGAVHGPGVRVTVTQRPDADQDDTVRDSDLALLADGLWAAGADAISINGQRLTAATAIRVSGAAIEVNGSGIAPPYTVLAIGATSTLQARFLDTGAGAMFAGFAQQGYFSYTVDNESQLSLPAAPARLRQLSSATVLAPSGSAPGGDRTTSTPGRTPSAPTSAPPGSAVPTSPAPTAQGTEPTS